MRIKTTFILAALLLGFFALHAETRVALVIGNGAYQRLSPLKNPVNDASDMAEALRKLGFEVTLLKDADLTSMEDAVIGLRNRLSQQSGSVGFFFYAGHGVQSGGVNYLIPADAQIASESFLKTKALAAQSVLDELSSARNSLNIVVLDACRDNPFSWSRSGSRGLSVVGNQPPGSIVVYATSAGSVAQDGTGRNGVFTQELLKNIAAPGLEIKEMFNRTGAGVRNATSGKQVPAVYNQFFDSAYLTASTQGQQGSGTGTLTVEKSFGAIRVEVKETAKVYVDGVYKGEVPGGNAGSITGVESGSRSVCLTYADGKTEERTVSVTANGTAYASFSYQKPVPQSEMIYVAGGTFSMGSTSGDDDEKPVHAVTVSGFYMAKTEVPQKEFQDIMGSNPSYIKGDNLPVGTYWFDAIFFCNAKSRKEGLKEVYTITGRKGEWDGNIYNATVNADWSANGYRLPTEAEWEWAARGGVFSRGYTYAGGNSAGTVAWYSGNSSDEPQAVGTKAANELGIYDLSGNVEEWCWDWYGGYASGSEKDPKGPVTGRTRALRGGCFSGDADGLRVSNRSYGAEDNGHYTLGFRTVRSN